MLRNYFYQKLFFLFLLISHQNFAQSLKIRVYDPTRTPLFGATVLVKSSADSTKSWGVITDTTGMATFRIPYGNFNVQVSSTGYQTQRKSIRFSASASSIDVILKEDINALAEVTIRGQKPLVRQEDDKTIVDPEPLAATSTNAYEIMEKTPGLFLDQDGNIYLSSTTPATIFINGREQKMSAADIASILKSLPPNSIEKIEILRTPSAKYDASGSGGVVNVILKKGVKIGLTGSLNAGLNQGRYGAQFVGVNLTNVNGGRTLYFNFNYNRRNTYDSLWSVRDVTSEFILAQRAYTITPSQSVYVGFGVGRELSKKIEISTDSRLSYNPYTNTTTNLNTQTKGSQIVGISTNTVANAAYSISGEQSVSGKFKIDTLGSELTADLSYNFFARHTDQSLSTVFSQPQMLALAGIGDLDNERHSGALQIDLKYKLQYKITLETGTKVSLQRFESDVQYFDQKEQQLVADTRRTNRYNFRENINALYLQASRPFGQYLLKMGIRLENTNMVGQQVIPTPSAFEIHRTDLFPYLYLSRKVAKIAGYELRGFLIGQRSITRPVYEYLNPGIRIIDQFLYETGNPTLKPQFTQTYEANISFDERPIFAIGRNFTQDIFTNVVYQDRENPAVTFRTYDNLGTNRETYFRILGAIPPGKRYFFVVGAQYNLNDYTGIYENTPLNFRRGSWRLFTFQQLKLDSRSTLNLNGFLYANGQLQFYELNNFGALNLSLNRHFLNRKLTLTANVADVFFTLPNEFRLAQGSIVARGRRQSDTRRVGINLRYNFGLRKREERTNPFKFEGEQ
ncbi:MAG: outer membrane beta-barrel protein [Runella sp.]